MVHCVQTLTQVLFWAGKLALLLSFHLFSCKDLTKLGSPNLELHKLNYSSAQLCTLTNFFLQRSLIDSTCEAWKFSPNLLLKEQINFTQGISKVVTFLLFLLPLPLNLKPRAINILGLLIFSNSIYLLVNLPTICMSL